MVGGDRDRRGLERGGEEDELRVPIGPVLAQVEERGRKDEEG